MTSRRVSRGVIPRLMESVPSTVLTILVLVCGAAAIGQGVSMWRAPVRAEAEDDALALSVLARSGRDLINDVMLLVEPAMLRTRLLSRNPELIGALAAGDAAAMSRLLNEAIVDSTEIDAAAVFNIRGEIAAVNTVYADGGRIDPERIDRIMSLSFSDREIVQRCVRNSSNDEALEFQTTCDITPALFDSSGLSVAYSVPIHDPLSGRRIGVISSRMRFDRLARLLNDRLVGGASGAAFFVGDKGDYFSEEINRGESEPPIPTEALARFVAPLADGSAASVISHYGGKYISLSPMVKLRTIQDGGVNVLMMADSRWVEKGVAAARVMHGGIWGAFGALLILVGGMMLQSSRLRRQRRDLLEAGRRAEAAAVAKSRFLANMSHEIRTPMSAIMGYTDILCDPRSTPAERDASVEAVRGNGSRLLQLINDILDLSRIGDGALPVERRECSPARVVIDVVGLLQGPASSKGLTLELNVGAPFPARVMSDEVRLRQAVFNLVANAIKFTDRGRVDVSLHWDRAAGMIHIEVADSGIGMSPEQVARLFKPFTQAEESANRRFGGSGLGLCITRHIALALGGDVEVRSTPGKGSVIDLRIAAADASGVLDQAMLKQAPPYLGPLPRMDEAGSSSPGVPVAAGEDRATPTAPPECAGLRVLLVEDGLDNQRLFSMFLRKAGATVQIAADGRIGLDAGWAAYEAGSPFDIILMDMQMPEMDGYQAAAELRRRGYPGLIIALTAHAMQGDDEKCLDAGCDLYLTKPIERRRLTAVIARAAVGPRRLAA